MSDLETFTDTVRNIEKDKLFKKRNEAISNLRDVLCLVGNEEITGQESLNGLTLSEALSAIRNIGAERRIEKATHSVLNKIAAKLIEEISNEA
tara:strand:+ start:225 stop:503 length:279 start_codon:yes stop_codon:yes gene_type:complete